MGSGSELQDYFNMVAYGGDDSPPPWIREEAAECGCRGSGWFLSQVDTYHRCPLHFHGQINPEMYEDS